MTSRIRRPLAFPLVLVFGASVLSACSTSPPVIRLGAVFPLQGSQAVLARQEAFGVQAAVTAVNRAGGIKGRQVVLDTRSAETPEEALAAVGSLAQDHVPLVLGAYSSELSIPAAAAASRHHLVYWEAGAVANQVTGAGSPWVFRVGADGTQLGTNSATFAGSVLAPRLGLADAQVKVVVVGEDDAYGTSVTQGVISRSHALGFQVAPTISYDPYRPDWTAVMAKLRADQPDVLFLSSYIPDGVAFRIAMLAAKIHVGAMIGTTMADCVASFGNALGDDAIGVFGSDRPGPDFDPRSLTPIGRQAYDVLARAVRDRHEPTARGVPTEEELSGFTAAWSLLHDVLPRTRSLTPSAIARAARHTVIAGGNLPNGAGIEFSSAHGTLGQNLRATGAIWQWQAPEVNVVVWPKTFATASPILIPLPVAASTGHNVPSGATSSSGHW